MQITVAYADTQFSKPITYVFDLMLSILGVEYEILPYSALRHSVPKHNLLISYGREKAHLSAGSQIHIYQSKLFSRLYKTSSSMPRLPLKSWRGLPVIYEGDGNIESLVVRSGNMIETNVDIIASSLFMLSRYEEILLDERDQYDRFPATASIAYKEGFLTRPIVNEYIDLLWKWIDGSNLGFKRRKLWNGSDFAVCLTHDVDLLRKYRWLSEVRNFASLLMKHRQPTRAVRRAAHSISRLLRLKRDPYWNLCYLMDFEEQHGFGATFYFMSNRCKTFNRCYSIEERIVVDLVRQIECRGFEVGLHGSFDSYDNASLLADEKNRLDEVVLNTEYGARQHVLRWKTPDTWRILETAGVVYDTTLGYAEQQGFRCGFCLPYRPFDVIHDRTLNVWELPLTVMDHTLQGYRAMSPEEAWCSIVSLLEVVRKHNGLFVLLWHNSFLDDFDLPGWKSLYERLMSYISSQNVLVTSGIQILRKWESDNKISYSKFALS